jgi:hypothetical protein
MPTTKLSYGPGGKDIDLPPTADASIYCESIFPFDRDTTFGTGMALPDVISGNAGKCNVQLPAPSQALSNPAWGLPSIVGTSPSLADINSRQWFFDTRDSSLTGEGPIKGGWREPPVSNPGAVTQGGGGKKRKALSRGRKPKGRVVTKTQKGRKQGGVPKSRRRGRGVAGKTRRRRH